MIDPRRDRKAWKDFGRTATIVVASLGFHALVLGGLALQITPDLDPPAFSRSLEARVIDLQLVGPRDPDRVISAHPAGVVHGATGFDGPPVERIVTGSAVATPGDSVPLSSGQAQTQTPVQQPLRRLGAAVCAYPTLLSDADRAVCDQRFGARASNAVVIAGSGDARRDARLAAEGAQALANYDERRTLGPAPRPVCDKPGPIADCEVEISVKLFSSRDGWLPGVRRRD